ncbi:MAG: CvpA family protein [Pseudomonadota bacterium]
MEAPLTVIDGTILILIVLSAILAMAQGLTRELLWIASITISAIIAVNVSVMIAPIVMDIVDVTPISDMFDSLTEKMVGAAIGGFVVFILCWIILSIITQHMSEWVDKSAISGVDRTVGFLFGIFRGLFIVGAVYILYSYFVSRPNYPEQLKASRSLPVLDQTAKFLVHLTKFVFPDEIAKDLKNHFDAHLQGAEKTPRTPSKAEEKSDPVQKLLEQNRQKNERSTKMRSDGISADVIKPADPKSVDIILDALDKANQITTQQKQDDEEELTRP